MAQPDDNADSGAVHLGSVADALSGGIPSPPSSPMVSLPAISPPSSPQPDDSGPVHLGSVEDALSGAIPSPVQPSSSQPASDVSSRQQNPYDVMDRNGIRRLMVEPGSDFVPSDDQIRALYAAQNNESWPDYLKETGSNAWDAAKGLTGQAAGMVGEEVNPKNWPRLPATALEAGLRGSAQDVEMLRRSSKFLWDKFLNMGGDDEQKFQRFKEETLANLWSDRAAQRGTGNTGRASPWDIGEPLPNATAIGSVLSGPIGLATGPVGDLMEAPFRGIATKLLTKVPGMADAAGLAAKGIEKAGTVAKVVGGLPDKIASAAVEKLVGADAASKLPLATGASVVAGAAGLHGLASVPVVAKVLEGAGATAEKIGQAGARLADTEGVSQFSRLQQIAKDASAPQWMRMLASVGNKPIGQIAEGAANLAGNAAKAGAHGAIVGGLIGAASGGTPEDVGGGIGSGAVLGAGQRIAFDPLARRGQLMQAKAADVARFYNKQAAFGLTPEFMAKNIGDATMLQAATLDKIFDGRIDIRFLSAADYQDATGGTGSAGAFTDTGTGKQILINAEAKRGAQNTFLHETGHALAASEVASNPQIRLIIDQAIGNDPAKLAEIKQQYAQKLATAQGVPGSADAIRTRLDAESQVKNNGDKDQWIYDELYAEHVVNTLGGKDIYNIASPSLTGRALDSMRQILGAVGLPFKENGDLAAKPSDLFSSKAAQAVIDSPELRQLTYKYLRDRNNFLSGIKNGKDIKTTATISRDQVGKTEAAPLHTASDPQGRPGNDFYYQTSDGATHPRTVKATRDLVTQRQAEVEKATTKAPAPGEDTDDFVKLRKTVSGLLQRTGQRLGQWFYDLKSYGPESKENAKRVEGAMKSGDVMGFWYHPAGTGRGSAYRESLRKAGGGLEVTQRRGIPFTFVVSKSGEVDVAGRKVKTGGNVMVNMLDLASADKKAYQWQAENKLDLWGGDVAAFQKDLVTYLKNHGNGQPGETGIGSAKRDKLNAFIIGQNATHLDKNVLRAALRGEDKSGIVRSFRLDRIESVKAVGDRIAPGEYDKKVLNLSPDVNEEKPAESRVPGRKLVWDSTLDENSLGINTPSGNQVGMIAWRQTGKGKTVEFQHMEISDDYQRQGLGEALMREAVSRIKQQYPGVERFTGNATSQGIVKLMRKVLGPEISVADTSKLAKETPDDWMTTQNRAHVRFKVPKDDALPRPQRNFQYSPDTNGKLEEGPERVKEAAIKLRGRVYTGAYHGVIRDDNPGIGIEKGRDGFITTKGRFISRAGAFNLATKSGQMNPTDFARAKGHLWSSGIPDKPELEATTFYGVRKDGNLKDTGSELLPRPQRNFQYSPDIEAKNQRQPNEEVRKVATDYMAVKGIANAPHTDYEPVNEERAKKLADAYEAAAHDPNHPEVKASYEALAKETKAQWDAMTAAGVTAEPWTKPGQPYAGSAEMRQDVAGNKHLWFFPTDSGFGENELHADNPLLTKSGVKADGKELLVNDLFRAVHDYFGHSKEGYEFGPRGEYNAYLAHSRMFSDAARPAMAAETLAQNSWVNFGKHLRDAAGNIPKKGEPGFVSQTERPYAEQKSPQLPKELIDEATHFQFSPDTDGKKDIDKSKQTVNRKGANGKDDSKNNPPAASRSPRNAALQRIRDRANPQGSGGTVPAETGKSQQITLHHWSHAPGLNSLDPAFHGTGIAGQEAIRKRDYPDEYVSRIYFGNDSYVKEPSLGPHHYTTSVDLKTLYDFAADPDKLKPTNDELEEAGHSPMDNRARVTLHERKIKEAGYAGYSVGDVAVKFDKTPVTKAKK